MMDEKKDFSIVNLQTPPKLVRGELFDPTWKRNICGITIFELSHIGIYRFRIYGRFSVDISNRREEFDSKSFGVAIGSWRYEGVMSLDLIPTTQIPDGLFTMDATPVK
jgi:hypothetical protein